MKLRPKGRVRAAPDVVFRELDAELVLLNLKTGTYFGLNETGARMWTLLVAGQELARVVRTLEQEYGVGRPQLESDLRALVSALREKGLLEDDED